MAEKAQPKRWRCLQVGCNPVLIEATAESHKANTGHRVAKWPVRSKEGKRRAKVRNQTGYYDQYNVGAKSREARGLSGHLPEVHEFDDEYAFGEDDF